VNKEQKSNIFMHPAALLVIVVGTAFFKTPGEARADEVRKHAAPKTVDGSGDSLTHTGRNLTLAGDDVSLSTIDDKLELAQNMSQLLIVAASTILAADADQTPASTTGAAASPSEAWSTYGKSDNQDLPSHHSPVVQNGFEISASDQGASSAMEPPAPASPYFETIVSSALKLMTDLNDILSSHSGGSSELAHIVVTDNGLSPAASGFNNEAGFLAVKAAAPAASTEFLGAQFAGATHAGSSASESITSQGNGFYETGTVVGELPADLVNVAPLATVATQVGNADNFLAGNNIFVELNQAGSITPISVQLASFAARDTTTTTDTGDHATHATDGSTTTSSTSTSPATSTSTSTSASSGGDAGTATVTTGNSTETITSTAFLKTLEVFLQDTPSLGVTVSHDHFIFYNSALTTAASNESITMAFTDGSSIEIVGQASTLVNIIAHAQA